MKVVLDTFYGDKITNELMHCADVFEDGKQHAEYSRIIIEASFLKKDICEVMKVQLEKTGKNVVFISVRNIKGMPLFDTKAYIKPGVHTVSDGKKFITFKDVLEKIGYKAETDQRMRVTSVSV